MKLCRIKAKTASGTVNYTGIFRSTGEAINDAFAKITGLRCVFVEVMK